MKTRSTISRDLTAPVQPACWQREAQAACLRLELPSGETHILSYAHFLAACLRRGDSVPETLCISFSGHEIEIDGHGLRELLLSLQDLAVKWVRTAPERFRGLVGDDSGVVSNIRITAVQ